MRTLWDNETSLRDYENETEATPPTKTKTQTKTKTKTGARHLRRGGSYAL